MIEVAQRSANPAACPPHLGSPALRPRYPCGCRGGPREGSVRSFGPASTAWTQDNVRPGLRMTPREGGFSTPSQDDVTRIDDRRSRSSVFLRRMVAAAFVAVCAVLSPAAVLAQGDASVD